MAIQERGDLSPGGQWCGSAWGYTVYYSEGDSLNVTLILDKLSQQGVGYNFDFKLAYKFLRRSEASLRYGNASSPVWRGDLVPGTYCDRLLTDCDTKPCRIQSPNFPGVYPRNVTCTYRIDHKKVPAGRHALLAVRQTNSHKIHIKDQIVKYDRSQRVLKLWDQCNVVQDYLTVWDGATRSSPVLARLCGGDVVPDIVSRGPHMLLEFHTSPYDNPFHPVPLSYLPGFELEVQVLFLDTESHSYVREDGRCEFLLNTFDASSGVLRNPRHSLPPNTTCRYHFQGRSNEIVWISFVKYHASGGDPVAFDQQPDCNAQLRIWDGKVYEEIDESKVNVTLLGQFCREDAPRLCDHALLTNSTRHTRPCSPAESYITNSPTMTIEQLVRQGSALYPVSFLLRYEFVDVSQQGQPMKTSHSPCDRLFKSGSQPSSAKFQSPKNIFYYGRGGAQNLTCILRFEAGIGERVQLTFTKMSFGNKECYTHKDTRSGRWKCDRSYLRTFRSIHDKVAYGYAEIKITEYPWQGIGLPRDCMCTNKTDTVTIHTLTSPVVEVNFTITMMNITEDMDDFSFEGEYKFLPTTSKDDNICSTNWGDRRLKGSSGEITLRNPNMDTASIPDVISDQNVVSESVRSDAAATESCVHRPWLIEPDDPNNSFIYIKIRGYEVSQLTSSFCATTNRIYVYSAMDTSSHREICPLQGLAYNEISNPDYQIVEIFSRGWKVNDEALDAEVILSQNAKSFVIEFIQREPGRYAVSWMEVMKMPTLGSASVLASSISPVALLSLDCPHKCPELNACISATLWCDGVRHCPSGFDEDTANCSFHFGVPLVYVIIGTGVFACLSLSVALVLCIRWNQQKRKEKNKIKSQLDGTTNVLNHSNHSVIANGTMGRYQPPESEPRYGTIQKYATVDKYNMGAKYSRYGVNDARYNTDTKYSSRSIDKLGQDKGYGGTLNRYDSQHSRSKGVVFVPSHEDVYAADGKDSFC